MALFKKILLYFSIFLIIFIPLFVSAENINNKQLDIILFYGDGCPHCAKEELFINKLLLEYDNLKLHKFEIYNNSENKELYKKVIKELNIKSSGVPLLIVGKKYFVGFYNAKTNGKAIIESIEKGFITGCNQNVKKILNINNNNNNQNENQIECEETNNEIQNINLPFIGEIDHEKISLPILTIIMAAIDGFNPCAMWVLLFLINLLLGIKNRKKMWILGIAFIVSSASVYFLFLSAWLNVVLFIGFVDWIKAIIALVAIISGSYHLYDFYQNRKGCKVTGSGKRQLIFKNLKRVIIEEKFFLALISVIIIAGLVNLVELLCSAGVPAVYVPILTLANLPKWEYYGYLIFYIFIFMLDDIIVYFVAMKTLQIKAVDSKFTRYSGFVGGIIMIIIGILLLFKPGWLMFG